MDPDSLKKPVFYLDGVAQDPSMIQMGYGRPPDSNEDLWEATSETALG